MTSDQVVAAPLAAHARNRASSALAYAFVFETTLRLWYVIGQLWPMDMGGISDVLDPDRKLKWFGLRWEDIDENMVLHLHAIKTDETTGASIIYPLAKAPMIMDELARWPADKRTGSIVVEEATGLPYRAKIFAQRW